MILHCMKEATWQQRQQRENWGRRNLEQDGFIHCSPPQYFWRVAPNFKGITDDLVLLCIEEEKLTAELRWEDGDGCGRRYPHIYGLVNNSAISAVLPFVRDEEGGWLKNPELAAYPNE